MNYAIDTDIEIPPRKGGRAKSTAIVYGFEQLEVGQSRFFPGCNNSAATAASNFMRLHPDITLSTRMYDADPKYKLPGTRVWRVK